MIGGRSDKSGEDHPHLSCLRFFVELHLLQVVAGMRDSDRRVGHLKYSFSSTLFETTDYCIETGACYQTVTMQLFGKLSMIQKMQPSFSSSHVLPLLTWMDRTHQIDICWVSPFFLGTTVARNELGEPNKHGKTASVATPS